MIKHEKKVDMDNQLVQGESFLHFKNLNPEHFIDFGFLLSGHVRARANLRPDQDKRIKIDIGFKFIKL